ncbi:MAG: hypothetical protein K9K21_03360, partial [Desulfotignum sp.]|nr:hypothetical protein [Desulfotignum sp.]MCF8125198.1 hypothetical protein [Desulfotignum sp.]
MIWCLRNIGVRLWITVLVAVPCCFYLMPWLSRFFSGTDPVFIIFFMVVFWYAVVSFLMHIAGGKMIKKLLQEADLWERAAILNKARKKYLQAVRIYDSFLLSPLAAGKIRSLITRSIARFSLTFDSEDDSFRQAVMVHLASDPWDETLVELWLKRFVSSRTPEPQEQDLMTRLADIHYGNPRLMPLLTRIFLDSGRMDFSAKQLFARAMEDPELSKIYRQRIQALLGESEQTLGRFPMQKIHDKTDAESPAIDRQALPGLVTTVSANIRKLFHHVLRIFSSVLNVAGACLNHFMAVIKKQSRWRFYVKAVIMGLLCLWLVVFIYNTVTHLKTPKPVIKTDVVIEK